MNNNNNNNEKKEIIQTFNRHFRYNASKNKLDIVLYNRNGVDESSAADRIWYSIKRKVWMATMNTDGTTNQEQYADVLKIIAHMCRYVEDEIEIQRANGEIIVSVLGNDPVAPHSCIMNANKEGKELIEKGIIKGIGYGN